MAEHKLPKYLLIYREYVKIGGFDVLGIAKRHNCSRQYVLMAVDKARKGSDAKFKTCQLDLRMECLWQAKYYPRHVALSNMSQSNAVSEEQRMMYHDMKKDGFTTADISRRCKKDHATIRFHLKK